MGKQLNFVVLRDGKGTVQLQLPLTEQLKGALEEKNLSGEYL
jgi:hypothetical protein